MSSAEEKFNNFDWTTSKDWEDYFGRLDPKPTGPTLEKFKRKWFNKNVDSSLELS